MTTVHCPPPRPSATAEDWQTLALVAGLPGPPSDQASFVRACQEAEAGARVEYAKAWTLARRSALVMRADRLKRLEFFARLSLGQAESWAVCCVEDRVLGFRL